MRTFIKSSLSLAPSVRAASIKMVSTDSTPEIVLKSIGKKHPRNMINDADFNPIPNHKIASGIHARGGTGRSVSIAGVRNSLRKRDQPMTMPRGMATATAREKPQSTLRRLYKQWMKRVFPEGSPDTESSFKAEIMWRGEGILWDGKIPKMERTCQAISRKQGNISFL